MPEEGPAIEAADATFMELALDQAEMAAAAGQTPFGAVVVDREGHLVGRGHNRVRAELDPTAHGEIVAIREAWRQLREWPLLAGSTMYTSCEPCLQCAFVITQMRFRRVVFAARGTDVPGYEPLLGADLTQVAAWVNAQPGWEPIVVVGGFMRDRALATLAAFPWEKAEARRAID